MNRHPFKVLLIATLATLLGACETMFVEWHKHRGLWRYFRKFEAPRRGLATRAAVFFAIFARFPVAALKALTRLATGK